MGITVSKDTIRVSLDQWSDEIEEQIIKILSRVGEEFVKSAREMSKAQGGFGDVTGNLRSSIGYFVLKDGEIIDQKIYLSNAGTDRNTGVATSIKLVEQMDEFIGYRLVGIAGMNYASHVESKGYNVISIQKELAFINLKEYFDAA
jgi:hypothetical protein